jgi:PilZ domain
LKQQDLLVGSPGKPVSSTYQPAQGDERRKSERFAISATAEAQELRTRTHLSGRASDLGAGGCYIDTVTPFPVGTTLMLNLTSENHKVRAKANVVYARAGMGMGLTFTEMTANQRENLSTWLGELSGELPKEQTAAEADVPYLQEATIPEPMAGAKRSTGVLDALQELVSLLGNKRVLSEDEVELLRDKLSE